MVRPDLLFDIQIKGLGGTSQEIGVIVEEEVEARKGDRDGSRVGGRAKGRKVPVLYAEEEALWYR